ncbi:FtsK/SpoIIIE domain-containing protein [Protaetiibacter mangrovi]|uniref:FtsK/SpoIIIE domain-containing protein n=1 Tax=Protaetiibacter mangrovi TaxID=2970926 RepID=A0ABT1ZFI0_9MICO|nr:FtsK/SpoIIIE domain-containing protein [Protaetiibacter mangrovi]MCS0499405.1 FtsK/SpoIIIE domain-containing protein [Protaetiibacter mangrovi]
MHLPPERLALPVVDPPAPRARIPVVAMAAPLVFAGVLWLVTASPYTLLFALLGPLVAAGSALDGRRGARRERRQRLRAARDDLAELRRLADAGLAARRREQEERVPSLSALTPRSDAGWWIGTGDVPSGIELVAEGETPELAPEIAELRAAVQTLRRVPILLPPGDELVVAGLDPLVRALSRALVLQAVARCAPGTASVTVPPDEEWASALPARCAPGREWRVETAAGPVLQLRRVAVLLGVAGLDLGGGEEAPSAAGVCTGWRPSFLARAEASAHALRLATAAVDAGWRPPGAIPASMELSELLADAGDAASSAATLGHDGASPVQIDLERDGPHALVAGTTGSGKSELLVSWVLALAERRSPTELAFLLVDFKGGAAFAPLSGLPHVVGVVSDLDPSTAERAVRSLRAELRRREGILAQHGVAEIGALAHGVLPRLVIVVDEFAALVAADPGLHGVFADLAARGRTLGLHLVLGTQRPAGVIRDAIAANVTVRLCLRVIDPADSVAVVGVPDAAALPAAFPGRAVLRDADGVREVQLARSGPGLAERIAARWADAPRPADRPWVDPLPARLTLAEMPRLPGGGPVVGLVDVPELQRREPFALDPWAGAVLLVGATGSGRSEALSTLVAASACATRWVVDEPAELWAALTEPPAAERSLVAVDDLDLLLARVDGEQRAQLVELLARAAREGRRGGVALAASARGTGGLQGAAGTFEQRVVLRLADRDEHLLAGADAPTFRADRRPGSAVWRGHDAQFALAPARPPVWRSAPPGIRLPEGRWALVTPDPQRWLDALAAAGVDAAPPGAAPAAVRVADADGWLAAHATLAEARREGWLLLQGCSSAELRTLTRSRSAPPLGDGDAWRVRADRVERVRLLVARDRDQARPSGASSASSP